jgi:DNA modification methylase
MPIRNISEIYVPEGRIRRTIDPSALEELITSILSKGLLHPPVVEDSGALLCGERRFRALQEIERRGETYHSNGKFIRPGLIQTTNIRELSPADRLEAELEENTARVDVTWQEKAQAVEALHRLRGMQKAEQHEYGEAEVNEQTISDTAAELKGKPLEAVTYHDQRDVKNDLIVATWLASHPDDRAVQGAKTRSDALRAIEKTLEDEHRQSLARQFLRARPTSGHILRQVDLVSAIADTPDALYDCIITDPPWGVGASQWQNGTSLRRHSYADDLHTFERIHECLAVEGYRISKPKAHLYLFCAFQHFADLSKRFLGAGWDVWPRPLIWWHGNQGIPPRPEHGPKNTYECILFANKGAKRVLSVQPDVIYALKQGDDDRAASKPPAIYYSLLRRSLLPGDEVLDPCCGTGPLLPAANLLQVRATCYDLDDVAIGIASQRMNEAYEHAEPSFSLNRTTSKIGGRGTKVVK